MLSGDLPQSYWNHSQHTLREEKKQMQLTDQPFCQAVTMSAQIKVYQGAPARFSGHI